MIVNLFIDHEGRLRSGWSMQYQALRARVNVSGAVPSPMLTGVASAVLWLREASKVMARARR